MRPHEIVTQDCRRRGPGGGDASGAGRGDHILRRNASSLISRQGLRQNGGIREAAGRIPAQARDACRGGIIGAILIEPDVIVGDRHIADRKLGVPACIQRRRSSSR